METLDELNLSVNHSESLGLSDITPEQSIGALAFDLSEIDFDMIIQDIDEIDVDRIIIEEFQASLDNSVQNIVERKSMQQIIAQVEFFMSQPAIQNAMSQLNAIARQFAHMCNAADGHGGFSVNNLTGIAKSFFEQGLHSENDGHNHGIDALKNKSMHGEDDHSHEEEDKQDEYEWAFVDGKWVRRKRTKKK